MYDEKTKTVTEDIICETESFYILLALLLITTVLLIGVSI